MGDTCFWEHDAVSWFGRRWFERLFWPLIFSLRIELLDYFCSHFVRTNGWVWLAVCFARPRPCCSSIQILCVIFFSHLPVIISWLLPRDVFCVWLPMCVVVVLRQALCYTSTSADLFRHLVSLQLLMIITIFFKLSTRVSSLISISEQAQTMIAILIMWAGPSLLLSLRLRNLYAQTTKLFSVCVCWHLISSCLNWDEVKGLCSLVYEDISSETHHCPLLIIALLGALLPLGFIFFPLWLCFQIHDVISHFINVLNSKWPSFLGCILCIMTVCTCCLFIGLLLAFEGKPTQQLQFFLSATGVTESMLGLLVLVMNRVYVDLVWNLELYFWYSLFIVVAQWSSDSVYHLLHDCNICVKWSGVMYMCVPALCPKALAQHHWMLRPAQWGLNFIKGIMFPAILQHSAILKTDFSLAACGSHCSFSVFFNQVATR